MEKRNLPNATAVLILGIVSILTCCCMGIGVVAGVVALYLASKDQKLYNENPDLYLNYSNLNTGRILAIIGTTLSAIILLVNIYIDATMTDQEKQDFMQNLRDKVEQVEKEQQQ